ncbi:MAG: flagellar hook-basal body complex protein FliE [Pseudomonadota bacterium]
MDMKLLDATKAYGGTAGRLGAPGLDAAPAGGPSFADMVGEAVKTTVDASARSEGVTALALNKEAELLDVVTAINNAEMTLETVVAVRDRVINAYNEIIRMPI